MKTARYKLVDTHVHLDELEDPASAVEEARQAGLAALIAVGMGYESNHRVLELAQKHRGVVYPALGLHPWEIARERADLDKSLRFIEDNLHLAVALGEVGLDYDKRVRRLADKEVQQGILRDVLGIARKHDMPVSVHSRYAWKDTLSLLQEAGVARAVFHWFTGFSSTLRGLLEQGYFISATPAAEYHEEHRRAVKEVPLSRLLLETDCPVTYGREVRYGSRPRHILKSLEAVAEVKGVEKDDVANATTGNAVELFGLPPCLRC